MPPIVRWNKGYVYVDWIESLCRAYAMVIWDWKSCSKYTHYHDCEMKYIGVSLVYIQITAFVRLKCKKQFNDLVLIQKVFRKK